MLLTNAASKHVVPAHAGLLQYKLVENMSPQKRRLHMRPLQTVRQAPCISPQANP